MNKNYSELEGKLQAGQSLSKFPDAILEDFFHIPWTRTISALNVLKTACGGAHHCALSACSELKLSSRRDRNLILNRP